MRSFDLMSKLPQFPSYMKLPAITIHEENVFVQENNALKYDLHV